MRIRISSCQLTLLCLPLLPLPPEHQLGVEEVQPLRPRVHLEEDLGGLQRAPRASEVEGVAGEASPEEEE